MGLNVRRNILYDPARRVVRIVDWDKAPTVMGLAPDFREVPLGGAYNNWVHDRGHRVG
jgi:hypothetical protein